jgi:hypothetical protein
MDASTPSAVYDELDLDVSFADSGLEVAGVDSEECTSDNCGKPEDSSGVTC